MKAYQPYS